MIVKEHINDIHNYVFGMLLYNTDHHFTLNHSIFMESFKPKKTQGHRLNGAVIVHKPIK